MLAPGTVEACFEAGWRAFNLAERYQCPAIILVDNYLSNSVRSIERLELGFEAVEIDRGALLSEEELDNLAGEYKRYALTESGISPRAIPGHPNAVFMACSDEHDEHGHFEDEDAETRTQMVEKRMNKLEGAREAMGAPVRYGPERAELTFVGWGSSYGPLREVVDRLNADQGSSADEPRLRGEQANLLHFTDIWPFPNEKVQPLLSSSGRLVCVESNATGQFARLLAAYTGVQVDQEIHRLDGRPLSPEYILDRLQRGENDSG